MTDPLDARDILEIDNLVDRYCLTTDNADVDGSTRCWVPTEQFGGYGSSASGSMRTWPAMHELETQHVGPDGMANGKRHQAANVCIEPISADEVRMTHDLVGLEVTREPQVVATDRYDDSVVVRTALGWRLKSRTLTVDPSVSPLTGAQGAG